MIELKHKKLNVWQTGIKLSSLIYKVTQEFPSKELYGLTSQMRRAAVSVPSNISEGVARPSAKERKRFFYIARSSLVELDTQLEIASNLGYLDETDIDKLDEKMNHLFAMLSNLIKKTT